MVWLQLPAPEVMLICAKVLIDLLLQFEIRSMLSQLSLKIQQDNDRKFEQLVAVVEDRFAARKFDPEEEKHLK